MQINMSVSLVMSAIVVGVAANSSAMAQQMPGKIDHPLLKVPGVSYEPGFGMLAMDEVRRVMVQQNASAFAVEFAVRRASEIAASFTLSSRALLAVDAGMIYIPENYSGEAIISDLIDTMNKINYTGYQIAIAANRNSSALSEAKKKEMAALTKKM